MQTIKVLTTSSALFLAAALAACGQSTPGDEQQSTGQVAAPEAPQGLSLSAAKLVLPAVTGNPAAAYFTLSNGGDAPASVAGVYIEGAENTEIHQTSGGSMNLLEDPVVPANGELIFTPGGDHVMVFGLDESLAANSTSEVTVTFANGDKISAPIWIEAAGLSEDSAADQEACN